MNAILMHKKGMCTVSFSNRYASKKTHVTIELWTSCDHMQLHVCYVRSLLPFYEMAADSSLFQEPA